VSFWTWLKSFGKPTPQPEAAHKVSLEGETVVVRSPDGTTQQLELDQLRGVVVETNDSGPWGMDLWWLLFGPDDRVALAFPGGAAGEQAVIDRLMSLPNFDHEEMIKAMGSADVAVFFLWRAEAEPTSPNAAD
jgi:hypothetical protein